MDLLCYIEDNQSPQDTEQEGVTSLIQELLPEQLSVGCEESHQGSQTCQVALS